MTRLTPQQQQLVETLFHRALEFPPGGQREYLDFSCSDPAVRSEVESLLSVRSGSSGFMAEPVLKLPAQDDSGHEPTLTTGGKARDALGHIGQYRLLEKLGEGGMGTVYLAEQKEPIKRRVALKLIKPGMDTRQVVARFEGERQALALMNHPNIARVLDAGTTEQSRPYFVMEYVHGVRITDYCDHRRLDTNERLDLFSEVCRAIQHAHHKGIIHRDLKPSNVLVAAENGERHPKVIDFGVAKAMGAGLTERTLYTEQGQLIGTPEYMSPEQADFSTADIDTRTDIYSLGVLLYELLTGALPMESDSLRAVGPHELQRIIREQEPPKPSTRLSSLGKGADETASKRRTDASSLLRQLRGDLDWVVMKCLEKDRNRRYTSAAALVDDIARFRRYEPVSAGPPSVNYRVRKFVRRHRALVGGAAAVLVVLVAGIISTSLFAVRESYQRATAQTQVEISLAVNKFLNDMLSSADPRNQGPDVTVRHVLDQAADRVETELATHPAVERSVRQTIGRTYRGLGLYDQALPHFQRALDLSKQLYFDSAFETAVSQDDLGALLRDMGRSAEAEPLHRQALEIMTEIFGTRHEEVAGCLNNLAQVLYDQGKYEEGRPLYKRAYQIRSDLSGAQDPAFAGSLSNLARVRYEEGDYAGAETLLRETWILHQQLLGAEHPDTIGSISNVAMMVMMQGDFKEAEKLFREAVGKYRRLYGGRHPHLALALNNLGESVRRQGRYSDAEVILREALAMRLETPAKDHPQIAKSLNNLALVLGSLEKYEEALELQTQALSIRRVKLGDEHPNVATSLTNLGFLLNKLEKHDQAREYLREALEIRKTAYGDEHPAVANTLMNLARCLVELEELEQAERYCRDALRIQVQKLGEAHPHTAATRIVLGHALTKAKRYEEAEHELLAALDSLHDKFDQQAPQIRGAYEDLIALYTAWGQSDRAAEFQSLLDAPALPQP